VPKEVDTNRIVVSGYSFGGIQTLLAAEKGLGAQAFIAFAAGAKSWGNEVLRERLENAVRNAKGARVRPASEQRLQCRAYECVGKIAKTNGGQAEIYPAFGNNSQDGRWGLATTNSGIEV
jgi:carboxymethylenebutenolidase